jgi:hypothetical protein
MLAAEVLAGLSHLERDVLMLIYGHDCSQKT